MIELVEARRRQLLPAGARLSLVIQVGDIECHRDAADLRSMAAPAAHRKLGDFADVVWSKRHDASPPLPWPVYFIGGNHECWGYLDGEHAGGGALCPNLFFAGRWAVDRLFGMTVVALSGVHRLQTYRPDGRPRIELIEFKKKRDYIGFTPDDLRPIWQLAGPLHAVDLLVVHDWPAGIAGRADMGSKASTSRPVGNQPVRDLVDGLRPRLVLAGHMHAAYRTRLADTDVCCLAKVPSQASVAIFRRRKSDGVIEELAE